MKTEERAFRTPVSIQGLYGFGFLLFLGAGIFLADKAVGGFSIDRAQALVFAGLALFMAYLSSTGMYLLWFSRIVITVTDGGLRFGDASGAVLPWDEIGFSVNTIAQVYVLRDAQGKMVYMADCWLPQSLRMRDLLQKRLPPRPASPDPPKARTMERLAQSLSGAPPRQVGFRPFRDMKGDWIVFWLSTAGPWIGTAFAFYYGCPAVERFFGRAPDLHPTFTDFIFPYVVLGVSLFSVGYWFFGIRKDWVLFKDGVVVWGQVTDVIDDPGGRNSSGTQDAVVRFTYLSKSMRIESKWANKPKKGDKALVLVDPRKPTNCEAYFEGDNSMVEVKSTR